MRYIREVKEGREEGRKEGNLVFNCVCCGSTLLLLVLGPQGALRLGEHPYINLSTSIYLPALVAANTHHLIALILLTVSLTPNYFPFLGSDEASAD